MKKLVLQSLLFGAIILLFTKTATAQFSISGEFRPRIEYRDGYAKLRDSSKTPYPDILGRNRLIFDFKNEQFTAKFSIQQAYIFGENNYSSDTISKNTINIYEGWFSYKFSKMFSFKIGRTELIYDDARLFGNSNWGPKGASHDVGIFQWENSADGYRGDFGFAINNTAPAQNYLVSYPLKNYKYMTYLYEQKKFMKDKLTISLLGILDVYQQNGGVATQLDGRFTVGGTAGYLNNKLKLFGSGYYQTGHYVDGRKLSAWMVGVYGSYQVVKPLNLLVGYDYLSGNDYSDVNGLRTKTTSFSTLYGTNHGFYGYMDLFTSQLSVGNNAGLTDLYLKANLKFSEKVSLEGTFRNFGLAKGYITNSIALPPGAVYTEVSKGLGSEVDMMLLFKPVKSLEINGACCFYMPTSTMESISGLKTGTSEWAQYAYIMLTFKPTFFSTEKH